MLLQGKNRLKRYKQIHRRTYMVKCGTHVSDTKINVLLFDLRPIRVLFNIYTHHFFGIPREDFAIAAITASNLQ